MDTTFDPKLGRGFLQPVVSAIIEQPDGKLLIGGEFISVNGVTRNRMARLNSDGSLDTSFGLAAGGAGLASVELRKEGRFGLASSSEFGTDSSVRCIVVQADRRVLVGGSFTTFTGTPRKRIARLNSDGSLDSAFGSGSGAGADGTVESMVVQSDGRVLIGGFFTSVHGASRNRIARLNTDGSLDGSFNVGSGANAGIESVALQADGKVLIAGNFTSVGSTTRNRIARLNSDGSLDTSFNPGTGVDDWVEALVVQTDGNVVIGGDFKTVNNTARTRLARLNSDGSLDTSFSPVLAAIPGYGMDIDAIALQDDGKLVIGGSFGSVNGASRTRVARLSRDGSLDTVFNPSSGPNDWVMAAFSLAAGSRASAAQLALKSPGSQEARPRSPHRLSRFSRKAGRWRLARA